MFVSMRMPTVPPLPHRRQQSAAKIIFVQNVVAVHAADSVHVGIEPPVNQRSLRDDHSHGIAHERVIEARKLPRAQVACNRSRERALPLARAAR